MCARVCVSRRPLTSHRRSEHVWFYSDISLCGVQMTEASPAVNNVSRSSHRRANVSTTVVQYSLSRLIDHLNDTQVAIANESVPKVTINVTVD